MNSRLASALLVAVFASASVSACDNVFGKGCTLAPCPADFTVIVHGEEDVEYAVFASAPGEELQSATCSIRPTANSCSVYLRDFDPDEVTVRVAWADQEATGQFTPRYETVHPNGPDCTPTCRVATVTMDVEQSSQLSNTRLEPTRDHYGQSN